LRVFFHRKTLKKPPKAAKTKYLRAATRANLARAAFAPLRRAERKKESQKTAKNRKKGGVPAAARNV
jgi:hypothetical protein